jgi:hypothetical protein
VQKTLMRRVHLPNAGPSAGHDRLDALTVAVADQSQRVAGKILTTLRRPQDHPDAVEKLTQSLRGRAVDLDVHEPQEITSGSRQQLPPIATPQLIGMIQLGRSSRYRGALTQ